MITKNGKVIMLLQGLSSKGAMSKSRIIASFAIAVVCFSCARYPTHPGHGKNQDFILTISWISQNHGKVSYQWVLERIHYSTDGHDNIQLNDADLKVIPLIAARYPVELLFCCEKQNMNAIHSGNSKQLIDSFGAQYERIYRDLYLNESLNLDSRKSLIFRKDTLNIKFEIILSKITGQICKCQASGSNPGSSFKDTVANVNNIGRYHKFTNSEKEKMRSAISNIFQNRIIVESLPFR